MVTLPRRLDFALVGAAKSGTSSLAEALDTHPQVHLLRPKDSHTLIYRGQPPPWSGPNGDRFNRVISESWRPYLDQLRDMDPSTLVGDAAVYYMADPRSVALLRDIMAPRARVVAILRRPDERAFSAYMHLVRDGHETLAFQQALAAEDSRRAQGWQPLWWYARLGHYAEQVDRLFATFGRENVLTLLYDDLVRDPGQAVRTVFAFLGVDAGVHLDVVRHNQSGAPKSATLQRFLSDQNSVKTAASKIVPRRAWLKLRQHVQAMNLKPQVMPAASRHHLITRFTDDIDELGRLIGRDLESWKDALPLQRDR